MIGTGGAYLPGCGGRGGQWTRDPPGDPCSPHSKHTCLYIVRYCSGDVEYMWIVEQAGSICINNLKFKNLQMWQTHFTPQKWKGIKKNFFYTTGLRICMNLRIFASFLYPTLLKICSQKFDRKQFYLSSLNFVIICITKK